MQLPPSVNYGIAGLLVLACLLGCGTSLLLFAVDAISGEGYEVQALDRLGTDEQFTIKGIDGPQMSPEDSPAAYRVVIATPPLNEGDALEAVVDSGKRIISRTDCLKDHAEEGYAGLTKVECDVDVPYWYEGQGVAEIRAVLTPLDGEPLATQALQVQCNWEEYELSVWGFGGIAAIAIAGGLGAIVLPVFALMYNISSREKHRTRYEGEYSLATLVNPFRGARTLPDLIMAFIASPLFWVFELFGVAAIVLYMLAHSGAAASGTAMLAFLVSGGIAFFAPFLWVAAWWLADYKEHEPLRIIASLFLWGCLSCLLAIGINTFAGSALLAIGAGALTAALIAPVVEEFFKGAGLGIFSLHHEYDSMSDGLVYGFTVGMGFAFIENWLYLLNNPMGANIGMWVLVFLMRSVAFSAMHGVYTSMTGGIIGLLRERGLPHLLLFLPALLPAIFFHSMHNASELVGALLGEGAMAVHCCIIMPLFDYGGLTLVALAMLVWHAWMSRKNA